MLVESGQVAVVTGAARGIGRAIATELASRGVSVVIVDLRAEPLGAVAEELAAAGDGAVVPATVDVADAEAMTALAQRVQERFGRIDLVINNAGIAPNDGKPMWEADLAQWRRVVDVNLFGMLHGIRAFVPHLVAAGRGHVVNIASLAGLSGTPLSASYGTSKHAAVALSEMLLAELELMGLPIGVTVVCPGFVRTPMVEENRDMTRGPEWADRLGADATALLESIEETMKDMLEPDEAARRVLAAVEAGALHTLPTGDVADGARTRTRRVLDAIEASGSD
ncbi:NAD(P)-dependent dehydrogenase (short-subunit alcohol dehydrogenase family) [Saccharopolyspora lacisalsi]|uniref:NAD(P)-dependent dehydrogenase (Short-subunit alcohol dehydrogenase family) n=1 Tax=Halosaccharopolyspora lacisalsi TaxID=1000566 RepID=A0A839E0J6_9PSEU|nr:SDR family NAD(P)-dependent oxidoreductase [Halosaccharopolyspora lacisalsi]MBA8826439.1 NAD(P)-dependent dehydrogenase (short-subunit alcohol dehydrogenase family) [Halosaccharopolyspora lacisalsi]